MQIDEKGLNLLKTLEGKRNKAYCLQDGGITIGYGKWFSFNSYEVRTGKITKFTYWNDKKCEQELLKEVKQIETYLTKIIPFKPTQNQFNALVSYGFNRGCGNLLKLLQAGKGDAVKTGLLMSVMWGSNTTYKASLINRRLKEMRMYFDGYIPSYVKINKQSTRTAIEWLQYKLNIKRSGVWDNQTQKRVKEYLRINNTKIINRKEIKKISNYSI